MKTNSTWRPRRQSKARVRTDRSREIQLLDVPAIRAVVRRTGASPYTAAVIVGLAGIGPVEAR
jgi:hypothetical protein